GMHGPDAMSTMHHIQMQHFSYAALGVGIAITKGVADTETSLSRVSRYVWPVLMVILGFVLARYTEYPDCKTTRSFELRRQITFEFSCIYVQFSSYCGTLVTRPSASSPPPAYFSILMLAVIPRRKDMLVKVGRYEILDTVGAGASGRVVRAHDPYIGRIVAIKMFPPEIARGAARDRFFQEARVFGQISHPAILALHDMGIDEATQTPYLVMEFVGGQPLDRVLEKGTVPFPRACAWIGDIAVALAVAHRKGVIHGDVKPANILINGEGRVKLSDFGMARVAHRDVGGGQLLGTPAYWCPEQIMGRPQDARSDLFSLGGVLYEMLTGQSPFHGDSIQAVCTRVLSS